MADFVSTVEILWKSDNRQRLQDSKSKKRYPKICSNNVNDWFTITHSQIIIVRMAKQREIGVPVYIKQDEVKWVSYWHVSI